MNIRPLILLFSVLLSLHALAQATLQIQVTDSASGDPLPAATLRVQGTNQGAVCDLEGRAVLSLSAGEYIIIAEYMGYEPGIQVVDLSEDARLSIVIALHSDGEQIDEITVESTRSNRSIAQTPTRTEVLTEEIDEAASMEPGQIAHLLTHSTGIQVQTTAASSNGAVVRIQGMNGRYTQMLKDGFPMYGGFSGSLDIMQIPPLDLRQVEYIKGPASTLYGGGAIGGLINLLSKKPEKEETLLHLNMSHIGARDLNAFASRRFGKFGFTNLASFHSQSAYDPDSDGYSDLADVVKFNFNPRLFYYPGNATKLYFGLNVSREQRKAGDMLLLEDKQPDSSHFFLDEQYSERTSTQFSLDHQWNKLWAVQFKNSISRFDRSMDLRINPAGERVQFKGVQWNSFSEFNIARNTDRSDLVLGLNAYTDQFREKNAQPYQARDQQYATLGIFINHLKDWSEKFKSEAGMRVDRVYAKSDLSENPGEMFYLPRISLLYQWNSQWSTRAGGGMGYRMPTIFNEESEPFGYQGILPLDFARVSPERSMGANFDIKYLKYFEPQEVLLTVNQMFFYNAIASPIMLYLNGPSVNSPKEYSTGSNSFFGRGWETQLKLTIKKITVFVGYTFTEAYLSGAGEQNFLPLTPKHSIKGDILFVDPGKWRIGLDYEYKSPQFLNFSFQSTQMSPALFSSGVIVERTLDAFVIFLNAENFTDTRQTRFESILSGPYNTPQFTPIYGPLDGFYFNLGLKIKL